VVGVGVVGNQMAKEGEGVEDGDWRFLFLRVWEEQGREKPKSPSLGKSPPGETYRSRKNPGEPKGDHCNPQVS
jgi:hypothetical protein